MREAVINPLGLRVRAVVWLAQKPSVAIPKKKNTEQVAEHITAQVMTLLGILVPGSLTDIGRRKQNAPQRDPFLPALQAHSSSIGRAALTIQKE